MKRKKGKGGDSCHRIRLPLPIAAVHLTVSIFSLSLSPFLSFLFSSVHVTHLCADKLRLDYATLFAYSPSLAVFSAVAVAVSVVIVFADHCTGAVVAAASMTLCCFPTTTTVFLNSVSTVARHTALPWCCVPYRWKVRQ